MYDRTKKCLDEHHTPELLASLLKNGSLNKGKFLTAAHNDSYYRQMLTIYELKVGSVLEIGPGEGFSANYLKSLGIQYDTMDIIRESQPTIISKLEDFDAESHAGRWELVSAFQMLEHSPYDEFLTNIRKMATMSSKYVFISLPYSCAGFSVDVNIALGQSLRFKKKFSFYLPLYQRNRCYRKEYMEEFPWAVHYWEIGRRGFPIGRIRSDIQSAGLRVIDEFRPNNPYHYYFLAEKIAPHENKNHDDE